MEWRIDDSYLKYTGVSEKNMFFPIFYNPLLPATYIMWFNSQLFPVAHFQTTTGSQVKTRERWQNTGNSWEKNKFLEHHPVPTDGCENGSWEEDRLDVVPVNVIILEYQVYVYVASSKFS